jgi:hypothetical protein
LGTLAYAIRKEPTRYRPFPKEILKKVRAGTLVKIWVEAVGREYAYPETVWGQVLHVDRSRRKPLYRIRVMKDVLKPIERSEFHGITAGSELIITDVHIISLDLSTL